MGRLRDKMHSDEKQDSNHHEERVDSIPVMQEHFIPQQQPMPFVNQQNIPNGPEYNDFESQDDGGEGDYEEDEYYRPPQNVAIPPPPTPPYEQPIGLPRQYYSTTYKREQYDYQNPLSILDEIKKRPSPKGAKVIMIGGRPLDLHTIEDYVVRVSPYHLRTILRYHNARTIEEIKNYSQRFGGKGMKGSTLILILLAVGMGILGVILMVFLPDILKMFSGGI
jgi:hypothetical protein